MRLYIAGPMRGYELFNFPAFDEAAAELREMGHEVWSPAEIDRELGFDPEGTLEEQGFDLQAAMRRDLAIITNTIDGIVLLPGWERSSGARTERFVAETVGRSVWSLDLTVDGALRPAPAWSGNPTVLSERAEAMALHPSSQNLPSVQALFATLPKVPNDEVRVTDPTTGGAKGQKLFRTDLLPADALLAVAEHFGRGARKYEDRNWEKGYAWSLSYAALLRHLLAFWGGEDIDEETGSLHLQAVGFHALALLAFSLRDAGTDDRPPSSIVP